MLAQAIITPTVKTLNLMQKLLLICIISHKKYRRLKDKVVMSLQSKALTIRDKNKNYSLHT